MNYDTIADTGFLLAFKVRQGSRAATVAGHAPARDVFRVDARTMGGHQKEVLVTEGTGDEGEILKGTDLAP